MSAELHRLTPAGPMLGPEPSVIEFFEKLLAEAKAGEVRGAGVFYVCGNGGITTNYIGGCAEQNSMAAGASMLNYRITKAVMENV